MTEALFIMSQFLCFKNLNGDKNTSVRHFNSNAGINYYYYACLLTFLYRKYMRPKIINQIGVK